VGSGEAHAPLSQHQDRTLLNLRLVLLLIGALVLFSTSVGLARDGESLHGLRRPSVIVRAISLDSSRYQLPSANSIAGKSG